MEKSFPFILEKLKKRGIIYVQDKRRLKCPTTLLITDNLAHSQYGETYFVLIKVWIRGDNFGGETKERCCCGRLWHQTRRLWRKRRRKNIGFKRQ